MLEILLSLFVIELAVYFTHIIKRDAYYDKIHKASREINEIERKRYAEMQLKQIEAQSKTADAVANMAEVNKEKK